MRWALLGLAAFAVTACSTPAPAPQAPLILAPDGIRVGTSGLEIGFGRTKASTVASMTKLAGPPAASRRGHCGTIYFVDQLTWPSGLTLTFLDGELVGWQREAGARGFELVPGTNPDGAGVVCTA